MSCRKWVVRGLVALVLAGCLGAGVVYQQWTNPAAVRQQVVEMLLKQFPGATVSLDGARLRLFGGVVLTELRLQRRGDGDKLDLLHIPQATVYHDKERLLDGQFAVRRIDLHRPRVHVVRDKDGKWNVQGLTGPGDAGGPLPTFVIHDGTLTIEDNFASPAAWELHDLNLTLLADPVDCLTFNGSGKSETFGAVEVRGCLNRKTNAATLALQVVGLAFTRDVVQYVASQVPDNALAGLQLEGRADVKLELAYRPGETPALKYDAACQVRQVCVDHPRLPLPLHNLTAAVRCTDGKLVLERLKAAAGAGKIECKGSGELPNIEDNFEAVLTAYHLPLTKELAEKLPASAGRLHKRLQPAGNAKVQVQCERRKGEWLREYCIVWPDNIGMCFDSFKYPIERVTGFADYDFLKKASQFEAVGYTGTRPVTLRGHWKGEGAESDAAIEVAVDDLPLDRKLLEALAPSIRPVAESFHPTGNGHFRGRICRVPGSVEYQSTYRVRFVDCTVKWDDFQYPLENVCGDLTVHPRFYEFANFHGVHNGGEMFLQGRTLPRGEPGEGKLLVSLRGQSVPFDGDLHHALKRFPGLSKTWETFAPAGRLNFQAEIERLPGPGQEPDMDIHVDVAGCAIEPSFFRYALQDVAGRFHYQKNKVEIANFTARHGGSLLGMEKATVDVLPRGGYYFKADDLRGNPVLADAALLRALPAPLRTTFEAVNLKDQPFALQTELVVSQSAEPGVPPEIFWDGQLWVQNAELRAGIELNRVTGTFSCRGLHNGKQLAGLCGNLYLNEATVFNQPFAGVRSHFFVRENAPDVLQFGLRAPLFGGDVSGHGRVEFNSLLRYEVDLTASQMQLEEFGKHNFGPKQQLSGVAAARLHLQGQGATIDGLEGNGSVDVPYSAVTRLLNLPLLLDLLKFLGLRWPDRTAFEEAHAAFNIQGSRAQISKLDLLGNVVSLYGNGEVNLDGTDLNLDMYPSWGRAEQLLPPAVRGIPSAISKHLLKIEMRGKVGGDEGDLKFTKKLVPGLVDPLLELGNRFVGK